MAKYLLLGLLGLSLCNCAGTIGADPARSLLQTYVGHPVSELIARFGRAKASFSLGGDKMAFQWDQSVLGQSSALPRNPGCRLDTIIAIARPMHPHAAPSEFQAWSVEGWQFGGADCV
jgi:hypothetical protein